VRAWGLPVPSRQADTVRYALVLLGLYGLILLLLVQLNEIGGHLAKGEAGGIRLELNGKNITPEIDLASDSSATKATRGPSDKGFDESLGITAADLERLVKSLVDAAAVKPTDGKDSK